MRQEGGAAQLRLAGRRRGGGGGGGRGGAEGGVGGGGGGGGGGRCSCAPHVRKLSWGFVPPFPSRATSELRPRWVSTSRDTPAVRLHNSAARKRGCSPPPP